MQFFCAIFSRRIDLWMSSLVWVTLEMFTPGCFVLFCVLFCVELLVTLREFGSPELYHMGLLLTSFWLNATCIFVYFNLSTFSSWCKTSLVLCKKSSEKLNNYTAGFYQKSDPL